MATSVLGINAFHGDASAAILIDGELVGAVEEERFNRIKHWAGFPSESIRYCLREAGIDPRQLDRVAISFDPKANWSRRVGYVLKNRPSFSSVRDSLRRSRKAEGFRSLLATTLEIPESELVSPIHRVEHHLTHLAYAFLGSPWEEAALLSIDGMGDFVSTMSAAGSDRNWEVLDRVFYPHSLGYLYNAVTLFLGFPHYGDEYKVMGLAPYGEPEFVELFREIVFPTDKGFELNLNYFNHPKEGIEMQWKDGEPTVSPFHSKLLEEKLGKPRRPGEACAPHHENIARSLQAVTEEIVLHLCRQLHEKTSLPRLCLAGGVAMNSVVNGKIVRETPFEQLFVPAGASDSGTAIGAALHVWHHVLDSPRLWMQKHAYMGSAISDEECAKAATSEGDLGESVETLDRELLLDRVVEAIIEGKVVGWYQGRMEFGARALGNRSLLADPRRVDMRDIINLKIKFREKFRPFAPSILEEHVEDWFDSVESSPFMERVLPIRSEKRGEIPAVAHVDGTGRLHTVTVESNPLYHALISRFHEATGVPILLNTSLNENEPIVRTPQEALACFRRTEMDMLVLGATIVSRRPEPSASR
ncbi:MAG: carbamoyltransferase C-terminal domain-containing protein [Verrucomicrobiota bacterium]